MDTVKYLKERARFCKFCSENNENHNCNFCIHHNPRSKKDIRNSVVQIENWARLNPIKTRLDVFKEQYPNGNNRGKETCCCVKIFDRDAGKDCAELSCYECKDRFWNEEVEE